MPRIVTRPVIASIASVTRPSWRNVVALRHWLRHAKTVIMSGMGGDSLCRILGWGIHSLHVDQPPCLISVLAKVLYGTKPHLYLRSGHRQGGHRDRRGHPGTYSSHARAVSCVYYGAGKPDSAGTSLRACPGA